VRKKGQEHRNADRSSSEWGGGGGKAKRRGEKTASKSATEQASQENEGLAKSKQLENTDEARKKKPHVAKKRGGVGGTGVGVHTWGAKKGAGDGESVQGGKGGEVIGFEKLATEKINRLEGLKTSQQKS